MPNMYHTLPDGATMYAEYYPCELATDTIVFINGLTQSTVIWTPFRYFFGAKYNVVLLDLVFQGNSSKDSAYRDFNGHAADVINLLDSISVKNLHIAGISYGGMVAQHLLVNYPDRFKSGILMATFAHKTSYYNAIADSWQAAMLVGGFALMLDVMLPWVLSEKFLANPLFSIEALKKLRVQDNTFDEALKLLMKATAERADYLHELQAIKMPVCVIAGEKDILFPVETVRQVATCCNAEFHVIPFAGHSLNVEAFNESIVIIDNFIGSIQK